jgi:hypothetical protein
MVAVIAGPATECALQVHANDAPRDDTCSALVTNLTDL